MGRPTLVSLATELGVSRQTVSNVINAPHLVKRETRLRVQDAIEASGYRPNQAAQALRNQRSRTIAMRVYPTLDEGINGAVMDHFLHEFAQVLRGHGYSLLLVTAEDYDDETAQLAEMAVRGRVDACVLTGTHRGDRRPDQLADTGIEVIAFGRPWGNEEEATHPWLDIDGAAGTQMSTQHLLDQGIRRIGFVGWPVGSEVGDDRREGWSRALAAAGVEGHQGWFSQGLDSMASGLAGMDSLLDQGVEAAVCASDSLALGALEALRRRGMLNRSAGPVFGFDNTPVARAMGLSSVDQNIDRAVEVLVGQLIGRLEHKNKPENPLPSDFGPLLRPRLVVRELGSMYVM